MRNPFDRARRASTSIGIYFQPETPVPPLHMYTNGIQFDTGRARAAMPVALDLV